MAVKGKYKSNYINPMISIVLSILIVVGTSGAYYWFDKQKSVLNKNYQEVFKELKNNKTKEVNSPIREIFDKISTSSDLVYWLSLFHTNPTDIIKEIEKAIYIWRNKKREYKIITNENFSFSNYDTVSFWLISTKLENYAELIKRLKKLYGNVFEVKGLKNFGIKRERTSDWKLTGKIFFTTNITLKYLKGVNRSPNSDDFNLDKDTNTEGISSYINNKNATDIIDNLIIALAEKRRAENKNELYFNSVTKDNAVYLGTDIEYNWKENIYYLNQENNLIDIFNLNQIGTRTDYNNLKESNFKALLITSKKGDKYAICTKILKEEIDETKKGIQKTKLYSKWNFKLDETLKTFCSLL